MGSLPVRTLGALSLVGLTVWVAFNLDILGDAFAVNPFKSLGFMFLVLIAIAVFIWDFLDQSPTTGRIATVIGWIVLGLAIVFGTQVFGSIGWTGLGTLALLGIAYGVTLFFTLYTGGKLRNPFRRVTTATS